MLGEIGTIPYTAIGSVHADPPNPTPAHEQPALLRELPDELVEQILELAGPESGSPQMLVELRLLGGELAREAPNASAFCHRDGLYSLVAIGVPTPDTADAVLAHSLRLIDAAAPWATGGVMPNFGAGNDLRPGEFRYDPETLTRSAVTVGRARPIGRVAGGSLPRRLAGTSLTLPHAGPFSAARPLVVTTAFVAQ